MLTDTPRNWESPEKFSKLFKNFVIISIFVKIHWNSWILTFLTFEPTSFFYTSKFPDVFSESNTSQTVSRNILVYWQPHEERFEQIWNLVFYQENPWIIMFFLEKRAIYQNLLQIFYQISEIILMIPNGDTVPQSVFRDLYQSRFLNFFFISKILEFFLVYW